MMISTVALSAYSADTLPLELQKQNSSEARSMIKDYGLKDQSLRKESSECVL